MVITATMKNINNFIFLLWRYSDAALLLLYGGPQFRNNSPTTAPQQNLIFNQPLNNHIHNRHNNADIEIGE